MKTWLYPFVFIGLACAELSAQQDRSSLPPILLERQSQVDSFKILFGAVTSLGALEISGPDITHLDSMLGLRQINGDFYILFNTNLQSLRGLDSLHVVDGDFYVSHNYMLTHLSGLESLEEVTKDLHVQFGPMINLHGLEGLRRVNDLTIQHNHFLESLEGIEPLVEQQGNPFHLDLYHNYRLSSLAALKQQRELLSLVIHNCDSLTHLDDLENLESLFVLSLELNDGLQDITGLKKMRNGEGRTTLIFEKNPRLKSLSGLDSMTVLRNLIILENDSLLTLQGLNQLVSLHGGSTDLRIEGNRQLSDINALSGINHFDGTIRIQDNPMLSVCDLPFVCAYLQYTTDPEAILNNNTTCISNPAVITACDYEGGTATGHVYLDMNCNTVYDSGEYHLPLYLLEDSNTHVPVAATDTAGQYIRYLQFNEHLTLQPRPLPYFTPVPGTQSITVDHTTVYADQLDFALCPDTIFHDLLVSVANSSALQPGYGASYYVHFQNNGTYVDDAILTMTFSMPSIPDSIEILDVAGNGHISAYTVTWTLQDLFPFQKGSYRVLIRFPATIPVGTPITAAVRIEGQFVEANITNNVASLLQLIANSLDPNDKWVNHTRIAPTDDDSTLHYLIRFQNTGNLPARVVEVLDTIDRSLDMSTFEMISASHPYQLIFPEDGVIQWRFDNIQLPDSTTNEPESHGYIHYALRPSSPLEPGATIHNTASIYFDFNAPIITNDAQTMVELETAVSNTIPTHPLVVSPNPVDEELHIGLQLKTPADIHLTIYTLDGRAVYHEYRPSMLSGSHELTVNCKKLTPGMYVVRITTNDGIFIGKMVKD